MRIKAFYKTILIFLIIGLLEGCNSNGSNAYVPESSGNINALTVVMPQALWSKSLGCLLYTSPSPRDKRQSRMPSSA